MCEKSLSRKWGGELKATCMGISEGAEHNGVVLKGYKCGEAGEVGADFSRDVGAKGVERRDLGVEPEKGTLVAVVGTKA